jgi:hypothetical protein
VVSSGCALVAIEAGHEGVLVEKPFFFGLGNGQSHPEHVSMSFVDRPNLSMRMSISRFTRDDVKLAYLETLEKVLRQAPHSAVVMQSPAEFAAGWHVTDNQRPVHNEAGQYSPTQGGSRCPERCFSCWGSGFS